MASRSGHAPPASAGLDDPAAPGLGTVEELAGARQRGRPAGVAAEHLGELDDPPLAVEVLDLGDRPAVALALGDPVVGIGVRRDLGQVGDAQDLVPAGEGPQAPPDRVRAATADPRVDLVEDEDRRLVRLGQDALDGQGDPRQLPARGDPRQRPGRLAGVRGEAVDDLVDPAGIEGDGIAVELDGGLVVRGGAAAEADLEDAGAEPELLEDLADGSGQGVAGRPASSGQAAGRRGDLGQQGGVLALAAGSLLVEPAQALELGGRALAVGDDLRLVVAVAALEGVDRAEPLLERGERRRVVVDAVGQAADLGGDVLQLGLQPGQPLGERLEPRVEPGQAARLADGDGRRVAGPGAVGGQRVADRGRSPGDRLAMLRGRQAGPDARRPRRVGGSPRRSRPPRARAGRPGGPARADRSPARPARPGSPASARPRRPSPSRAASSPPNASSRSRCQRSSSRRCCSCWPWISTSGPTSSASREAVVARSSSRAVDRPPVLTSRTAMSGSGSAVEQRLDARRLGAVADEAGVGPRARGPARARRSAGSCRRRSRR